MHLIEVPNQERETAAIRTLLDTDPLIQPLFHSIGLRWPLCWCMIQLPQEKLISGRRGDVDILAGNLNWNDAEQFDMVVRAERDRLPHFHPSWHYDFAMRRLASDGGLAWPPSIDHVVAIEVKCSYFAERPHATKRGKARDIRKQIGGLLKMAFDRVVLLDVIANEPATGAGIGAWTTAAWRAHDNLKEMRPIFDQRIISGCKVDHFAISIGSVVGKPENLRGAGRPTCLHLGGTNFDRKDVQAVSIRSQLNCNIGSIWNVERRPNCFPVVLWCCR